LQFHDRYSTIATTSDARLKTNVTNTDVYDCLETINKLRVVDFHWKSAAAKAGYAAPHETTGGGQPVPFFIFPPPKLRSRIAIACKDAIA